MDIAVSQKELELFGRLPGTLPLYLAVEEKLLAEFGPLKKSVGSSQVGYKTKYGFAFIWPPFRKEKDRPAVYVYLTFGLDHRLDSPRIAVVSQPRHNRFTHHFVVQAPQDVDEEVMGWLREAYVFSLR